MNNPSLYLQIRTKKLGLLIYDARLAAGKTLEECAKMTGIDPNKLNSIEKGYVAPSLPEVEILSYVFNIPTEHFWGNKTLSTQKNADLSEKFQQLLSLRHRMIGANIKKKRTENSLSSNDLAEEAGFDLETFEKIENGELEITIPKLELIAKALHCPIEDFFDSKGFIGQWREDLEETQKIKSLPEDLKKFVAKPINIPYIELAIRLSELDVNRIRSVAEGLLEITL
jgi:transcriptional regulator with XRE-family HTH domain